MRIIMIRIIHCSWKVGDSERGDFYQMEFRQHKRDYYCHKLGYSQVTQAVLREQVGCLFLFVLCCNKASYKGFIMII